MSETIPEALQPLTLSVPLNHVSLWFIDGSSAHEIDAFGFDPSNLHYVDRATLAARLRAVADIVDPGSLAEHDRRWAAMTGGEVHRP